MPVIQTRNLDTSKMKDEELMAGLSDGDMSCFTGIVERYRDRLINFLFRFVGDRETAEDIVQETFLRVFKKRSSNADIMNFSTWIFTIASNLAKTELRRRKRWRSISIDAGDHETQVRVEVADDSQRPDNLVESRILDDIVHDAIRSLPPKYRQAILMRDVQGLSYEEISRITECPVGTIKSRANRSRLRLQRKLRKFKDEIPPLTDKVYALVPEKVLR